VQPLRNGCHRNRMVVFADVRALARQGGAIGEAMVHQNPQAPTMEPSHHGEAARMLKSEFGGGLHHDGPM